MRPQWIRHVVRGAAFEAHGRRFVPEARVTTLAVRQAMIGTHATRVSGLLLTRVRPTALIEYSPDGERYHRIEEHTGRKWLGLAIATGALLILDALVNTISSRRPG